MCYILVLVGHLPRLVLRLFRLLALQFTLDTLNNESRIATLGVLMAVVVHFSPGGLVHLLSISSIDLRNLAVVFVLLNELKVLLHSFEQMHVIRRHLEYSWLVDLVLLRQRWLLVLTRGHDKGLDLRQHNRWFILK